MTTQLIALAIFIAVFAVAAMRNVNIGIVMFPWRAGSACGSPTCR